ncbi:PH domain-containing protein [Clostridium rectalis]|uniref:PH domain-containing protein n=1 Tax=Clostridium rectalis TaxID=2040295 RepID=UPI000F63883F|nr:PH domain-containing protein [Clostridium rectalis]
MIEKPTRNHWSFIVINILKNLKEFFIFILMIFIIKYNIYLIIVFSLFIIINSIVKWKNSVFYVKENMLVFKEGIFSKSKQEIPFHKISTVNIDKNFIDRILKTCTVKVDSGSAVAGESDFEIKVKYDLGDKIRQTVLSHSNNGDEKEEDIKINYKHVISIKEIIIYSLTKSKIAWAFGIFFIISKYIDNVKRLVPVFMKSRISQKMNMNEVFNKLSLSGVYLVLLIISVYVFISVIFCIFEIIKLYNFSLEYKEENINIKYGMISKKEYSIPVKKINALRYKQNFFQKKFKIYSLEAISIGYGDESNEQAIVYPMVTEKFQIELLENVLPEFKFYGEIQRAPKRSISKFIFKSTAILFAILVPLYFKVSIVSKGLKIVLFFAVLLLNFIRGYLNYSNTSLGVDKKNILVSCGSIKKVTTLIKQDRVQSITKTQNIFQRYSSVVSYKIDIYSNSFGEVVNINNMDENTYKVLYKNLIF